MNVKCYNYTKEYEEVYMLIRYSVEKWEKNKKKSVAWRTEVGYREELFDGFGDHLNRLLKISVK